MILDRISGDDRVALKGASSHGMGPIKEVHDDDLLEALAACSEAAGEDEVFADTFEHVRLLEEVADPSQGLT